jgi:Winged helix-turn helix
MSCKCRCPKVVGRSVVPPRDDRLLALALVLDGHSRSEAAVLDGMDRQTLRDWVHRCNAAGIDGLKSGQPQDAGRLCHSNGRPSYGNWRSKGRIRRQTKWFAGGASTCMGWLRVGLARRPCAYDRQMAEPVRPDTPATAAVPSEESG